jgi:hypothetical protein
VIQKKVVDVIEIPDTPDGQIAPSSCVMERLFPVVARKPSPVVDVPDLNISSFPEDQTNGQPSKNSNWQDMVPSPDWLEVGQSSTTTAYSGEIMLTL